MAFWSGKSGSNSKYISGVSTNLQVKLHRLLLTVPSCVTWNVFRAKGAPSFGCFGRSLPWNFGVGFFCSKPRGVCWKKHLPWHVCLLGNFLNLGGSGFLRVYLHRNFNIHMILSLILRQNSWSANPLSWSVKTYMDLLLDGQLAWKNQNPQACWSQSTLFFHKLSTNWQFTKQQ